MSLNISPPPLRDAIVGIVPQSWARFFEATYRALWRIQPGMSGDNGNKDITLVAGSAMTQRFNTPLTMNRTVTLPVSNIFNGMKFSVVRESGATGAFSLAVGSLKTLTAASQWCEVEHDGTVWRLTAYGTL